MAGTCSAVLGSAWQCSAVHLEEHGGHHHHHHLKHHRRYVSLLFRAGGSSPSSPIPCMAGVGCRQCSVVHLKRTGRSSQASPPPSPSASPHRHHHRSSAYNTSVATARLDSRQFDVQLNSQQLGAHGWYARQCPSLHLGEQGGYRGVITAITVITAIITSIIITTVIISTLADLGRSVLQQLASARDSRQLDPGRAA